MTTHQSGPKNDDALKSRTELSKNIEKIEELSARLVNAMAHKRHVPQALQGPGQELFLKAATAYMAEMMAHPHKMFEHQVSYWGQALSHYVEVQNKMLHGDLSPAVDRVNKDRRFADDMWASHPFFNYIKQQYLLSAEAVQETVDDLDSLDPDEKKRLAFFSRQIMDLFSPTNFLATNPEALAHAVETDGQSLVDGLENLVRDVEAAEGEVQVQLADQTAFRVGENLATTPGQVVFRNDLFELIQYEPMTDAVDAIPLLIFPPWINKFYILDLREQNSMIRWLVSQGFTVFVVSWVNPDERHRDISMTDYVNQGYRVAIEQALAIADADKINLVGYCIAGTTLALTLSLLAQENDNRVNTATFFTSLTDFSDRGEVGVFLDDGFVDGLEAEAQRAGIIDGFFMSRTFSYLRANDLIYAPAIRSYMMGKAPPAFDLLYWNSDSTNLPGKMGVEYLRGLCQRDEFATKGFMLGDKKAHISDVSYPLCAIACETDHIAAWRSCYCGFRQMPSKDKTFILAESGHIAGIVSPPSKNKYGHYTNDNWDATPEEWLENAKKHEGSWWPRWATWLRAHGDEKRPASALGQPSQAGLGAAPGRYVLKQPKSEDATAE